MNDVKKPKKVVIFKGRSVGASTAVYFDELERIAKGYFKRKYLICG